MAQSPFPNAEAANIIGAFLYKELMPLMKEINGSLVSLPLLRIGWEEAFSRKLLTQYEKMGSDYSKRLLEFNAKWSDTDSLFSSLKRPGGPPDGAIVATYMQFTGVVDKHFERMLRLLAYADQLLVSRRNRADFMLSLTISLFALVVGIFSIVLRSPGL